MKINAKVLVNGAELEMIELQELAIEALTRKAAEKDRRPVGTLTLVERGYDFEALADAYTFECETEAIA